MENDTERTGDLEIADRLRNVCLIAQGESSVAAAAVRHEMRLILGEGDEYTSFYAGPLRDALERYVVAQRAETLLNNYHTRLLHGWEYTTTSEEDLDFGPVDGGAGDGSSR